MITTTNVPLTINPASTRAQLTSPLKTLNFMVIEGPAGSGKTTVIKKLEQLTEALYMRPYSIADFQRPRSYEGLSNLALSQIKDTASELTVILQLMGAPETVPIVDRWMLSQMVYGRLRRQQVSVDHSALAAEVLFEMQMIRYQYQLLLSRDGIFERTSENLVESLNLLTWPRINIFMAVLLPTEHLLESTRQAEFEKSGRRYPYPAKDEVRTYQEVSQALLETSNRSLPYYTFLHVERIRVESFKQLDTLATRIDHRYLGVIGA